MLGRALHMAEKDIEGRQTTVLLTSWAHLAALWGVGVLQPLLEPLGNAGFLPNLGWSKVEIVVFTVLLAVLPPLVLVVTERLAGLVGKRWQLLLHAVYVGVLSGIFAGYVAGKAFPDNGAAMAAALVVGGVGAAIAFLSMRWVRLFLVALVVAPVLAVLSFAATGAPAQKAQKALLYGDPPSDAPPVVVIGLDEFPLASALDGRGRIDAKRLPAISRLAEDSTWYPNMAGVSDATAWAFPSILSGMDVTSKPSPPGTLFTLLGRDYRSNIHEQKTYLCPAEMCDPDGRPGFLSRMADVIPDLTRLSAVQFLPPSVFHRLFSTPSKPPVERAYRSFLRGLPDRGERRTLSFLHLLLPHSPWVRLPDGTEYTPALPEEALLPALRRDPTTGFLAAAGNWTSNETLGGLGQQAHLAQLGATDRLVGRVIEKLRRTGEYDRSLIVLTADHGASFERGRPFRTFTARTAAAILNVPLLVKLPGQTRARVDSRVASSLDLLPTIADAVDTRIPWQVDGHSLLGPERHPSRLRALSLGPGEVFFDPESIERGRRRLAAEMADRFGAGTPAVELWRLGPCQRLMGAPEQRLRDLGASRLAVELDTKSPSAGATLDGVPAGTHLALARGGRVVATTQSYPFDGRVQFSVLLPPPTGEAEAAPLSLYRLPPGRC